MHRYLAAIQSHVAEMEDLEMREMMSASPTSWSLNAPVLVGKAVTVAGAMASKTTLKATTTSEPAIGSTSLHYASFAKDPLFSPAGPTEDDVRQGELGDCYLLASLSSLAKANPTIIRNDITLQPDGSYFVAFTTGKKSTIERVDTELPVLRNGQPAYAQLGASNSLWVALMEKAFAEFRGGANSYKAIEGGWMGEVYGDLGVSNKSLAASKSSTTLLSQLQADLKAGDATTVGTPDSIAAGVPLLADHAYVVDRVNLGSNGKPVSVRLRNPWGIDGIGKDGADDGYVTLTATQVTAAFSGVCIATK